jgi:hypothetical protein
MKMTEAGKYIEDQVLSSRCPKPWSNAAVHKYSTGEGYDALVLDQCCFYIGQLQPVAGSGTGSFKKSSVKLQSAAGPNACISSLSKCVDSKPEWIVK